MFGLFITLHILICLLLMVIILMQSGRGGGLTENFASAESMFGTKTNTVLVKGTAIFATVFLVTCLSLAIISSKQNKSLISSKGGKKAVAVQQPVGVPVEEPKAVVPVETEKNPATATPSPAPAAVVPSAVNASKPTEIKQATENANNPNPSAPQAGAPEKSEAAQ